MVGYKMLDESSRFMKDFEVKNETGDAQSQVPQKDPVHVDRIGATGVKRLIASPKRDRDRF